MKNFNPVSGHYLLVLIVLASACLVARAGGNISDHFTGDTIISADSTPNARGKPGFDDPAIQAKSTGSMSTVRVTSSGNARV